MAGVAAAFSEDLLPQRRQFNSDSFDQHMIRHRKSAYRQVLVALAVFLTWQRGFG